MKFSAIVRNQPSPFGTYGKITSKKLGSLIGQLVIVSVRIEKPPKAPKSDAPPCPPQ